MNIRKIRKAIIAGAGAFVTGIVSAAVQDGHWPGWPEVGTSLGLAIAAALAAWRVPNATSKPVSTPPKM